MYIGWVWVVLAHLSTCNFISAFLFTAWIAKNMPEVLLHHVKSKDKNILKKKIFSCKITELRALVSLKMIWTNDLQEIIDLDFFYSSGD